MWAPPLLLKKHGLYFSFVLLICHRKIPIDVALGGVRGATDNPLPDLLQSIVVFLVNLHLIIEFCDAHVLYDLVHSTLLHSRELASKVVLHDRPQDKLLGFTDLLPCCHGK